MTRPRGPGDANAGTASPPGRPRTAGRRRQFTIALGVYGVLVAGTMALSITTSLATPLAPILALTAAGLGVLVVALRRPGPAYAAALALAPLSFVFGTGAEIALLGLLLLSASIERPPRTALLWYVAALVSSVATGLAFVWRRGHGTPILGLTRTLYDDWLIGALNIAGLTGVCLLVLTLLGINSHHRSRHVAELTERAESLKRERAQQISIARSAERERIAREMHDVIAHSLAVMIALSDGALASGERRPQEARRAVERIGQTGRNTLAEVRRLLGAASDDPDQTSTTGSRDLVQLVEDFRVAGLPVRLEISGKLPEQAALELTVYRIVQESLTNTLRHARGVRSVIVRIGRLPEGVSILVQDLSRPARQVGDPGRGIVGIRERAAFFGGAVEVGPQPSGGWRVTATLPIVGD